MEKKPAPKTGIAKVWSAFFYTLKGLRHAMAHEAVFRQEVVMVDLADPEFHELAGRAKDMGSAAVFLCFFLAGVFWLTAIVSMIS